MSAEIQEIIGTKCEPTMPPNDNAEETGSLLLTAVCEEPPLLPRFKANASDEHSTATRKKANTSNNSAAKKAEPSELQKKRVNAGRLTLVIFLVICMYIICLCVSPSLCSFVFYMFLEFLVLNIHCGNIV